MENVQPVIELAFFESARSRSVAPVQTAEETHSDDHGIETKEVLDMLAFPTFGS